MGDLRIGETDRFRMAGGNWYIIITFENGKIHFRPIPSSSKSNLKELAKTITELEAREVPFEVLGVWHGRRRTDIFLLDPKILKKRLMIEFGISYSLSDLIRETEKTLHYLRNIRRQLYEQNGPLEDVDSIIDSLERKLEVLRNGAGSNLRKG